MSMHQTELLQFPCQFPIKVMGINHPDFEETALTLVRQHIAEELAEDAVQTRLSKNERYLAMTITITATSKEQLDAIYQALSDHPMISVAL